MAAGRRHDRYPKGALQSFYIYMHTQSLGFVHKVHVKDNRQFGLDELEGERQHTRQVLGIHHMDHDIWPLAQQDGTGDPLLLGDGQQAVHTRRVHHAHFLATDTSFPMRDFYRRAGVIGDSDISAGQAVEQDALAHVRASHNGY